MSTGLEEKHQGENNYQESSTSYDDELMLNTMKMGPTHL